MSGTGDDPESQLLAPDSSKLSSTHLFHDAKVAGPARTFAALSFAETTALSA